MDNETRVKRNHEVSMIEKVERHDLKKRKCHNVVAPKVKPLKVAGVEKRKITNSATEKILASEAT
jgi:hypothetical protein